MSVYILRFRRTLRHYVQLCIYVLFLLLIKTEIRLSYLCDNSSNPPSPSDDHLTTFRSGIREYFVLNRPEQIVERVQRIFQHEQPRNR